MVLILFSLLFAIIFALYAGCRYLEKIEGIHNDKSWQAFILRTGTLKKIP